MFKSFIGLSAEIVFLLIAGTASADNFLSPVHSSVCIDNKGTREEIKYKLYDKAAFMAAKSSEYMQNKADTLDDHHYDLFAYKIADKALENISTSAVEDKGSLVCIKLAADLNEDNADKIFAEMNVAAFSSETAEKIAKDINAKIPASPKASDAEIPLIYIKDIEFYNHTTSSAYTDEISAELSLEPDVFVIEDESLADYILIPRLLQSKGDKIDETKSRYSTSVEVELQKSTGETIDKVRKNRYVIISDNKDIQATAQKLLVKLLKECLNELKVQFKNLH